MSSDIEAFVKRCSACTKHRSNVQRAPMQPIDASRPFEKMAIDLTDPSSIFDGSIVLTAIDYYSRFPFVFFLKTGSSREVVEALRSLFSLFGVPESIISDNGTAFTSSQFESFLGTLAIKHSRSAVYFPQSNGLIERFHGTFKHRLVRVREDSSIPLKLAVEKVMFDIRNSPTTVHGETPFSRLFKRQIRSEFSPLSLADAAITAPTRNYRDLYDRVNKRRKASTLDLGVGERVLLRQGRTSKFTTPATIVKRRGKGSWLVQTSRGLRTYNQYHIVRDPGPTPDFRLVERQDAAYDSVQSSDQSLRMEGIDSRSTSESTRRYNLRPRSLIKKPEFFH